MPYHVYIVEPPTLLDNLLEDSASVFHRHCAIIQRIFHDYWLKILAEWIGQEQLNHPNDNPALVEARARESLRSYRLALREKQAELIQEERDKRFQRDAAIHAYVDSRIANPNATAAA